MPLALLCIDGLSIDSQPVAIKTSAQIYCIEKVGAQNRSFAEAVKAFNG